VVVVTIVVVVVGESELPPVDTLGFDDEQAAPSRARPTTQATSPARKREVRRGVEWDGSEVAVVRFVMTRDTGRIPVRFTEVELAAASGEPLPAGRLR
jgi:hypothetical protein